MADITTTFAIDAAVADKRLLGAALGEFDMSTWMVVLKSAFALGLVSDRERQLFEQIAGGRAPPEHRVRALWALVGRRGGKSRMAALIACYVALFLPHKVAKGERPMVLVLAPSIDAAKTVFDYAKAFITESPVLRKELVGTTASEIRLRNGVTIAIHPVSFRSVRGRTLLAVIFDEIAWWRSDESATPDSEVYTAVMPSLSSTLGMLIGISTPYRRMGLLHQMWREHYGVDSPDVLVVQGPTTLFNPTMPAAEIALQRAADPAAASAEWDGACFRSDLSSYLDDDLTERAIDHGRPLELPPRSGIAYYAFTDSSGGVAGGDAYTICVGHKEGERYIIDLVRGSPPGASFEPDALTQAYAALLKEYRIGTVHGDFYAAGWTAGPWSKTGTTYVRSPIAKSQIYIECLSLFAREAVSLPDHARMVRELRLLERRTHRSGRDVVDHGRNGTDDFINSVCGVLRVMSAYTGGADLETYLRVNADGTDDAPPPRGLHPQYERYARPPQWHPRDVIELAKAPKPPPPDLPPLDEVEVVS